MISCLNYYMETDGFADDINDMLFDELLLRLNSKDLIIIDVRQPSERESDGFIPGSINLPVGEISQALDLSEENFQKKFGFTKPSKDDSIVFHCKAGRRALHAFETAKQKGYSNLKVYAGSFQDWKERAGPIEFNSGQTESNAPSDT